MKNKVILVLILILLSMFFAIPALADVYTPGEDDTDTTVETDKKSDPYDADVSIGTLLDESAEKATVENLKGYIDDKSSDIIGLMQYGAEPILLIAFMIAAFLTVCGIFGDGSLVLKGIIGMVVCGAVYTIIIYGPQALGFISGFFAP